jgi:DNA-binding response OmpR family regulator
MRKPLVLIIEDEAFIVADLEASLVRAGFTVAAAPSCSRTQKILELVEPDVAILDVVLRDCESAEIARTLLARRIPFVVHTGVDERDLPEPFKVGAFVSKPADISKLVELASAMAAH